MELDFTKDHMMSSGNQKIVTAALNLQFRCVKNKVGKKTEDERIQQ